jgi:hypothetical protein
MSALKGYRVFPMRQAALEAILRRYARLTPRNLQPERLLSPHTRATLLVMVVEFRKTIDMAPDGTIRSTGFGLSWPMRIGLVALAVSFVCGAVAVGAIMLYLAAVLIPVALVAAGVAYVALRVQMWRLKGRSIRGARSVFRP